MARRWWLAGVVCVASAAALGVRAQTRVLRPGEIIAHAKRYIGQTVEVEIVEPLDGSATPEELGRAERGYIGVAVPDRGEVISGFVLVPRIWRLADPNRYKIKFDRVLLSPLRVRGELLDDPEMHNSRHQPYLVLRVTSAVPIEPPAPTPLRSLADVAANPSQWDRRYVVYEGVYHYGFEISSLDRDIWLEGARDETILGDFQEARSPAGVRVRATGYLFAKPGARYGHLGAYRYELYSQRLEALGAARAH